MNEDNTNKLTYSVVTVEKTTAPEGMTGNNWHRYVIGGGSSPIEGKRTGSFESVTEHAESAAEILNSRAGKSGSTYRSSNKR